MSACFRISFICPFFKLMHLLIMIKVNQFLFQHSLDRLLQVMPLLQLKDQLFQLEDQLFFERQPPQS